MKQLTEKECSSYLDEIKELIELDPVEGSEDAERLNLISLAVENYEKNKFYFGRPTAIEAIRFRMDEMGLKQQDLAQYLGGKNRASEILSKERVLTVPMMRALHKYLDIPLEVLMQDDKMVDLQFSPDALVFDDEVMQDIKRKGWVEKNNPGEYRDIVNNLLRPIGGLSPANVLCRSVPRANVRGINQTAIFLWASKVLLEAQCIAAPDFIQEKIDSEFLRNIARLSYYEKGPLLAQEELLKNGIVLVIVPHLASTYLDGGVIFDDRGGPIIGLSLRYDRLDNFWHTLMHELVHVYKHFKVLSGGFFDDMDVDDLSDPIEKEADQLARDFFIPKAKWRASDVIQSRTEKTIYELANELHINPAIVAGRVRFETKKYSLFSNLLGANTLRKMFGVAK